MVIAENWPTLKLTFAFMRRVRTSRKAISRNGPFYEFPNVHKNQDLWQLLAKYYRLTWITVFVTFCHIQATSSYLLTSAGCSRTVLGFSFPLSMKSATTSGPTRLPLPTKARSVVHKRTTQVSSWGHMSYGRQSRLNLLWSRRHKWQECF